MFKHFTFKINLVTKPFDNLKYRDKTVLIVCKDSLNNYILGGSDEYPSGIVRLLGGGIEENESPSEAAIRELKEEVGIRVGRSDLSELAIIHILGTYVNRVYRHSVYLYYCRSKNKEYTACDDVCSIVAYSEQEFKNLIRRMLELGKYNKPLSDFGKVYGFIHKIALEESLKPSL